VITKLDARATSEAMRQCDIAGFIPCLLIPVTRNVVLAVTAVETEDYAPGSKLYIRLGPHPACTSCPDIFSRRLRTKAAQALLMESATDLTS
jgi:hypothetical protein